MMKNKKLLKSFTAYCNAHPEERFYQALKNWSGWPFIFAGTDKPFPRPKNWECLEDTFYFEEKKK